MRRSGKEIRNISRMESSNIDGVSKLRLWVFCLLFGILFLSGNLAFASEAKLTNLVIHNTRDVILIDLKIKGIFSEEMRKAVFNGIPVSISFLVVLYEVHGFWFDKKLASITAVHKIQFDVLKKEYRIRRLWEKADPLVVKNFEKAQRLMSEIKGLKIMSLKRLKKGGLYQLRVKSELNDQGYYFYGFPWEYETDWYTINFVY